MSKKEITQNLVWSDALGVHFWHIVMDQRYAYMKVCMGDNMHIWQSKSLKVWKSLLTLLKLLIWNNIRLLLEQFDKSLLGSNLEHASMDANASKKLNGVQV